MTSQCLSLKLSPNTRRSSIQPVTQFDRGDLHFKWILLPSISNSILVLWYEMMAQIGDVVPLASIRSDSFTNGFMA